MMNTDGMLCNLKSDLFKLKKMKSVWIGLAVMFALMLIIYCIYWAGISIIENMEAVEEEDIAMKAEMLAALISLGKVNLAGYSDTCALSLFVAIITCLFVGKDFSNGAIRVEVSRGTNRVQLFFSKWLSLVGLIVVYSVFAMIVCGIFTSFRGYGEPFTGAEFGLLMRCFALQLLCNISTMSIVFMLAFLCRSSGSALGATIGVFIALSLVFGLIETIIGAEWTIFMPLQQDDLASSVMSLDAKQLCAVIFMPIVYGALAIGIGLVTFLKRDIK